MLLTIICFSVSYAQINVSFEADRKQGCESAVVNFTDTSTSSAGTIVSWNWSLNGGQSSEQNPGAIFNNVGEFTICLEVTDSAGNKENFCKQNFIKIYKNPIAAFSANQNYGCVPSQIDFSDESQSLSKITEWNWTLGGSAGVLNTNDPSQEIKSVYTIPGLYGIGLTVVNEHGCENTTFSNDYLDIDGIEEIQIKIDTISFCGPNKKFSFSIINPESNYSYSWDFGNGNTYNGLIALDVTFTNDEIIDLTIIAENSICTFTEMFPEILDLSKRIEIQSNENSICLGQIISMQLGAGQSIDSVIWNFGDGNVSQDLNVNHLYEEPGEYLTSVVVFHQTCIDTIYNIGPIQVIDIPDIENIEIDHTALCTFPVQLLSSGTVQFAENLKWIITGPSSAITDLEGELDHQINQEGTYSISCIYTNELGCQTTKDFGDLFLEEFELTYSLNNVGGCIPLDISPLDSLENQSNLYEYAWNIGNGLFLSNEMKPTFTLEDTGKYDLQLIVTNELGCKDTIFRNNYFRSGIRPVVDFEAYPKNDCANKLDTFIDLSSSYADQWQWDFGDGTDSDEQNPLHKYDDTIAFTVTLEAWHNGCRSKEVKVDFIKPIAPISIFRVHYNCIDPYTIDIEELSIGADSLNWYLFRSPNNVDTLHTRDSLQFTFDERGNYRLFLETFNFETGCEYLRIDTIKITDPLAQFALDTLKGCAPLQLDIIDQSLDASHYRYSFKDYLNDDTLKNPQIYLQDPGIYSRIELEIEDIHECKDTFELTDSIYVNQVMADIYYRDNICVPDTISLNDNSKSLFGVINQWDWSLNNERYSEKHSIATLTESIKYNLSFLVKDDWNCSDSLVVLDALMTNDPMVDFSADTLSCTWQEIIFENHSDQSEVAEFQWDFGDGNQSTEFNPVHLYQLEGTYTVCLFIESSSGCQKTICKENYIRIANPIAKFAPADNYISCPPLNADFINNSINSTSFLWDFGEGFGKSNLESPSQLYNEPGTYDVQLIAILTENCQDTMFIEDALKVDGPTGSFEMIANSSCVPLEVELNAFSDGIYSYTWDFDNGILESVNGDVASNNISYLYEEAGTYIPRLILTDSSGCTRSFDGEELVVNDLNLDFSVPDTIVCLSDLAQIRIKNLSESTSLVTSYNWEVPNSIEETSNEENPKFSFDSPGVYNLKLNATSENCTDSLFQNAFIDVIERVSMEAIGDTICFGDVAYLNAFGNAMIYNWRDLNTDIKHKNTSSLILEPLESTDFQVIGSREICVSDTAVVHLKVHDKIEYSLTEEYEAYLNVDIQIDLDHFENEDYTFSWFPEDYLSCTQCPQPWIEDIDRPLTYDVLITDQQSNCEIEESVLIRFSNKCSSKAFYLPNVFSPNDDGSNDGYRIFAQEESEFIEMYIFDRWGEKMFYTDDITKEWNGMYKGKKLQPAIYSINIKAICSTSNEEFYIQHTVAIVR